MKSITFYESRNRDANLLHIETDGCTVNIQVGLTDDQGRKVTRIDVSPQDESRGGDGMGYVWHAVDGPMGGRIVRQEPAPGISDVAPWGEQGRRTYDSDGRPVVRMTTCGTCGRTWDDALITSITPAPAGRCPFEYEHTT